MNENLCHESPNMTISLTGMHCRCKMSFVDAFKHI